MNASIPPDADFRQNTVKTEKVQYSRQCCALCLQPEVLQGVQFDAVFHYKSLGAEVLFNTQWILVAVSSLVCELFNFYCVLPTQLSGQTCSPLQGRIIHLYLCKLLTGPFYSLITMKLLSPRLLRRSRDGQELKELRCREIRFEGSLKVWWAVWAMRTQQFRAAHSTCQQSLSEKLCRKVPVWKVLI